MQHKYYETIQKMGNASYDPQRGRFLLTFPVEESGVPGEIKTFLLSPGFCMHCIDIHSKKTLDFSSAMVENVQVLKINYCSHGRCELELHNGEYTYLTGGEIAIDVGQAKESFGYPSANYEGLEFLIHMDEGWQNTFQVLGSEITAPEILAQNCARHSQPQIAHAEDTVARIAREIREYVDADQDNILIAIKALELLFTLQHMSFSATDLRRTYYTTTQVDIAKAVQALITQDLSVRYTAKDLAKRFRISESSLKNYFRSVYGCGYAEYQNEQRMKKAAALLEKGSEKVVEIAGSIGYASQAKFGVAFKAYYGVTPLEYRRNATLSRLSKEEKK